MKADVYLSSFALVRIFRNAVILFWFFQVRQLKFPDFSTRHESSSDRKGFHINLHLSHIRAKTAGSFSQSAAAGEEISLGTVAPTQATPNIGKYWKTWAIKAALVLLSETLPYKYNLSRPFSRILALMNNAVGSLHYRQSSKKERIWKAGAPLFNNYFTNYHQNADLIHNNQRFSLWVFLHYRVLIAQTNAKKIWLNTVQLKSQR